MRLFENRRLISKDAARAEVSAALKRVRPCFGDNLGRLPLHQGEMEIRYLRERH